MFFFEKMDKSHCFMNMDYFDEYEDFFDFSSQFEELEQEDNLTRKLAENKNVHYDVIRIAKEGNMADVPEEGEWEDDEENKDDEKKKRYRLYKIRKVKLLDNMEILLPNGKMYVF